MEPRLGSQFFGALAFVFEVIVVFVVIVVSRYVYEKEIFLRYRLYINVSLYTRANRHLTVSFGSGILVEKRSGGRGYGLGWVSSQSRAGSFYKFKKKSYVD